MGEERREQGDKGGYSDCGELSLVHDVVAVIPPPPSSTRFPYMTVFWSFAARAA